MVISDESGTLAPLAAAQVDFWKSSAARGTPAPPADHEPHAAELRELPDELVPKSPCSAWNTSPTLTPSVLALAVQVHKELLAVRLERGAHAASSGRWLVRRR